MKSKMRKLQYMYKSRDDIEKKMLESYQKSVKDFSLDLSQLGNNPISQSKQ